MKYEIINSLDQYRNILTFATHEERKKYFRYTMMSPLKEMWNLINVPIKAKQDNGYDVLMATGMLGYIDIMDDSHIREGISLLEANSIFDTAESSLKTCIEKANKANLKVNANEIMLGIYLADSNKLKLQKGYTGFGGIPGYITINIYPNEYNIPKVPAVIAHEFHHNLRFSYFSWDHGNVTVGEYLVIEGLADSFATELYGIDSLGPWVTNIDSEDLEYSIKVIEDALNVKGFAEVSSYMFGDEIAKQEGYAPVGLSFCAGYAVGYEVVQSYMKKNNKTIYEATLVSSDEIIRDCGLFSLKRC
ncbi:DUF2268 domain-containing putative Zn-dependent protease [Alkalicoccobacillus gibsonii]|uniref:DUF2268 domain-containing protein n=1 Tax=Alkalicoccobacillus gibsonii TaxID=79881 RepID=UPI001932F9B5|nr:DUF2268 domain-containing protein [Alkalicoccobacillus gibsonii]MBM0067938.1 DUF2268 domain-containing protein [Alkalicoccobacillus gibsonii]